MDFKEFGEMDDALSKRIRECLFACRNLTNEQLAGLDVAKVLEENEKLRERVYEAEKDLRRLETAVVAESYARDAQKASKNQ
jgi:hypothetical protein